MKKEITIKTRTLIFMILSMIVLIVGVFFLLREEANKHCKKECQICSDMLVKNHLYHNFHDSIVGLSMEMEKKSYINDFFYAIRVERYVESIGKNEPYFIVDKNVCSIVENKNLTEIVNYGYAETLKRTKDNRTKILEKSFFEGLEIIKEKCKILFSKGTK